MSKLVQDQLMNMSNKEYLDKFWNFIYERHRIWYVRFVLEQPAPWTEDPILQHYKFTNVYRELDRGTLFLLDNIKGKGNPVDDVWNIIIYRMFNRISTYEIVGYKSLEWWQNPKNFRKAFDKWRAAQESGQALYTDAHMVCAYEHFPGKDKLARFEYIFAGVLQGIEVLMRIIQRADTLGKVHAALVKFPGIGPFLAYEMAVDISYCEWNNLGEDEWVNPGPGCQRGLKKIFPRIKNSDFMWRIKELRAIQSLEFARLKLPFKDIAYEGKELTLRNIEHCLCEYSKWHKALTDTGRPRNVFKPKAETDGWVDRLKG